MNNADEKRVQQEAEAIVADAKENGGDINLDLLQESLVDSSNDFHRYYAKEIVREVKKLARKAGVELTKTGQASCLHPKKK